jgi:multisubunit Na+/H+ antiporter MnhE subunit
VRGRLFVLFIILFAFWLVISSAADLQHILAGVLIAFLTAWFWHDLGPRLPEVPSARRVLRLAGCLFMMVGYVIQANISVARILLFSRHSVDPVFMVLDPGLNTNWGRVLLATCITITPGTITVDIDPETGHFIVHALTEQTGKDLLYWRLIDRIKKLEAGETATEDNGEKGA